MIDVFTQSVFDSAWEMPVSQLIEALPDASFICDRYGCIMSCSGEVLPFFSINDKKKIIDSNLQSYFSFDSVEDVTLLLSVVYKTNARRSNKFLVKKNHNETRYANVYFSAIQNTELSEKYILVIFREISGEEIVIDEINKKGARLYRIFETISNSDDHPIEKSTKLLSQVGETMGAITCSYFQIKNGQLNPVASWESPFNPGISPQLCNRQIFDYINDQKVNIALVRKPLLSTFLASESVNVPDLGVKTILGVRIGSVNNTEGIIVANFTSNFSLSETDTQFIQTISDILADKVISETSFSLTPEFSFRELIDCFSDPVYILSAEGIIMEANKSTLSNYGYEYEELIGQMPALFSAEYKNDKELIANAFIKALHGDVQKLEWWGQRKNGDIFPIEIKYSKSRYYGKTVILAMERDLTESKKIEKELIRYNAELEESNNNKDKFLSILAHDLKNPFQGLLGFIDLLYDDLDELSVAQVKEYLTNVRSASYHTYALLENLLEWSRLQSGKMPFNPTVFNIRDEISSVISVLENNARTKNIKLLNEVDNATDVEADRNMIHSVIQNLITNSIKFSNTRGRVVIRSREMQAGMNDKSKFDSGHRHWLEVSISDDGIGIPEEILPRLFQLNGQFSQAGTANEPGTGLGLVLCHEMVEKNGGRIWAESAPGQGTTFIFTVPLFK